jgi:two-component system, OmpR family, response regulator
VNVLLVEDDERIVRFLQQGLRAEGYQVQVAGTGREALALARADGFSVIILDLRLPDQNGRALCRSLRALAIETPILMLTAMDTLQDKITGLRSGADDYMTKPFSFEELLARLEVLLRRRGAEVRDEPAELSVADLVLNRETHEVRRGIHSIELTPKEFALLECFMRVPGRVLSRTRILEQVWGYSTDPLTNIVDVYVRQLRRKIDEPHERKLLHTVRGYGYKLDAAPERQAGGAD